MNNKKKNMIAVAMKYTRKDIAPKVIAKGNGYVAKKIIEKGKEEKVEIYNDDELANKLINIDIGQEIPEELYTAVAEILAFVYNLDKKVERNNNE